MTRPQDRVAAIEALISREVGRGAKPLMDATTASSMASIGTSTPFPHTVSPL